MSTERPTTKIGTHLDLDADGRHYGYLSIPRSHNDSAWGAVQLPVASIRNGDGPKVLLTGGNHGDEYEGPIALMKLARGLDPAAITGQVIVIPALNYPAVLAGTRVSPIDDVNMNRAFPGDRDGSISSMIAHYVTALLIPRVDAVADIHSGGKTLMFSPFACYHRLADAALTARARDAAMAFAAPVCLELVELDAEGMLDTEAESAGKVFVSTELGGGGTATAATVAIAETGIVNLLTHFGILAGRAGGRDRAAVQPSRLMHMPDDACHVISRDRGLYEPLVDLDTVVDEGTALGQIHCPERPDREPVVYRARRSGVLIGRAHKVLVAPGDFLAMLAEDMPAR